MTDPLRTLCRDCADRLAEHYESPGRVRIVSPEAFETLSYLAQAIDRDPEAREDRRASARAVLAQPSLDTPRPLFLVVHTRLCATCTERARETWGGDDPVVLTPEGALLFAELADEYAGVQAERLNRLWRLRDHLAALLVDDLDLDVPR